MNSWYMLWVVAIGSVISRNLRSIEIKWYYNKHDAKIVSTSKVQVNFFFYVFKWNFVCKFEKDKSSWFLITTVVFFHSLMNMAFS